MPAQGPIHVDRPLSNISIAYRAEGLIADELFRSVPVKKESDQYYVFDKAQSLKFVRTLRADGADANQDNLLLSTASYRIQYYALKDVITDRQRENADEGLNLEIALTEDLSGKLALEKEVEAASMLFTNGNWDNESSLAAAGAWSANTTVSNPILVADSAAAAVLANSAKPVNTCVMDNRTYLACKEHVSVVDRVKYTSQDSVTPQLLARLFGVQGLHVAKGQYNSAQEGAAASMGPIWTDSAWFGYNESAPGLRKVSALLQFQKGGGATVKRWRDEGKSGDFIEVERNHDLVAPCTDAGYLVVNTVQ